MGRSAALGPAPFPPCGRAPAPTRGRHHRVFKSFLVRGEVLCVTALHRGRRRGLETMDEAVMMVGRETHAQHGTAAGMQAALPPITPALNPLRFNQILLTQNTQKKEGAGFIPLEAVRRAWRMASGHRKSRAAPRGVLVGGLWRQRGLRNGGNRGTCSPLGASLVCAKHTRNACALTLMARPP